MLSKCFVSEGQGKDFLDLLASQKHASMVAAPKILQFAGEHATIATGDMEDPNEPALSLDILPNVNGPENISLIIQFDRRCPTFEKETEPAVVTKKMALLTKDGQDSLLNTNDTYRDADGNERLCVLLVRPEITFRPEPDKPTERASTEPPKTTTVLAQTETSETTEVTKDETPIVTSIILAKVRTEAVLDRKTIEKVAETLALDRPGAKDEIQQLGTNATLGQVLRKCIIGKPLTDSDR